MLDRLLGEPVRWHPLVGFGSLVQRTEALLLADRWRAGSTVSLQLRGVLAVLLLVCLPAALVALGLAQLSGVPLILVSILLLYFTIGWRSLREHALAIAAPLQAGDMVEARRALSMIVSRDTRDLPPARVAAGAIESVLENGSDAVLAPLFWYIVAGPAGAVGYRLANTLDAMWGYRTERYRAFGWAAARLDDVLNWLPARGCAAAYAVSGNVSRAWHSWRTQGALTDSPNAGVVMAAGAGALGVQLGGAAAYRGVEHERPELGAGLAPTPSDIGQALSLLTRAVFVWLLVLSVLAMLGWLL